MIEDCVYSGLPVVERWDPYLEGVLMTMRAVTAA
jgi:hypothetical protein